MKWGQGNLRFATMRLRGEKMIKRRKAKKVLTRQKMINNEIRINIVK